MSISYPLSLPSVTGFRSYTFSGKSAVALTTSEFTYKQQLQEQQGQLWMLEVELPPLMSEQADEWIAFLSALHGQLGTFLAGDVLKRIPRGIASGAAVVHGANQTGHTLLTDGWSAAVTGILKANDYIQIGTTNARLYRVLKDVDSNSSGEATLDIWPRLRESPSDNTPILTSNTVGLFRLSASDVRFSTSVECMVSISFSAIEAI